MVRAIFEIVSSVVKIFGINIDALSLEDFYILPLKAWKLLGFNWDSNNSENATKFQNLKEILRRIYFGICNLTILTSTCLYATFLFIHRDSSKIVLRTVPNVFNNVFLYTRFMVICCNKHKFKLLLNLVNEVFPKTTKEQATYEVPKFHKTLIRRQLIYIFACLIPTVLVVLDFIISFILNDIQSFHVDIWIPFDHTIGINYFMACSYLVFTSYLSSSILFIGDWILYSFIIILSMNFNVIGGRFKHILNDSNVQIDDVKQAVHQHVKLMEASNILESIFSSVLLLNFTYGSFVMCLICFQLVVLDDPTQILIYGAVLAVITSQIFLLCHYGQQLIDSSVNVGNEIYDSNWYAIKSLRVKKMIPKIMRVAQQGKNVSAWEFVDICHETFTSIFNTSYSYLSLLRQMYAY